MKRILFSFLAAVALISCGDKNDDPVFYSPDEAKAAVRSTMDGFYDCLKKANDGGFANALFHLLKQTEDKDEWVSYLGDVFYNQYTTQKANGNFDYQGLKGTYTWNFTTQKWDKTAGGNNITWIFPATTSSTTNTGRAVLDRYEVKTYTIGNETTEVPIKAHGVITIDNVRVAEVTLNNVAFKDNSSLPIPTALDLEIYTNPFTTTLKVNTRTDDEYVISFLFSSPEGCVTGINANVKLAVKDLNNVDKFEAAIDNFHVVAVQNDLQVVVQADVKAVDKLGKKFAELTTEEFNTYAKGEVFKNAIKIADVKYEKENDNDVIYFVFSDGSKVKAEEYVTDFEQKVRDIFKRFYDNN